MWKVVGYMEPSGSRNGEMHGPLPRKVWTGGTMKRWRKIKPALGSMRPSKDEAHTIDERRAHQYALWLAARDGLTIPPHRTTRCVWSTVESRTRTHTRRARWEGDAPDTHPTLEHRIRAVEYGHMREVYNERKDGKRGAWLRNEFVPEFHIDLPNWDFNPEMPCEEIIPDAVAA